MVYLLKRLKKSQGLMKGLSQIGLKNLKIEELQYTAILNQRLGKKNYIDM